MFLISLIWAIGQLLSTLTTSVFPVCIKLIILHCFFWSADHIFSSEVVWGLKYSYPEDFQKDPCSVVGTGLYSVFEAGPYSAALASLKLSPPASAFGSQCPHHAHGSFLLQTVLFFLDCRIHIWYFPAVSTYSLGFLIVSFAFIFSLKFWGMFHKCMFIIHF